MQLVDLKFSCWKRKKCLDEICDIIPCMSNHELIVALYLTKLKAIPYVDSFCFFLVSLE